MGTPAIICAVCLGSLSTQPWDENHNKESIELQPISTDHIINDNTWSVLPAYKTQSTMMVMSTNCGHLFHLECVKDWLIFKEAERQLGKCPFCKSCIDMEQCKRVYPTMSDPELHIIATENAELRYKIGQMRARYSGLLCQLAVMKTNEEVLAVMENTMANKDGTRITAEKSTQTDIKQNLEGQIERRAGNTSKLLRNRLYSFLLELFPNPSSPNSSYQYCRRSRIV